MRPAPRSRRAPPRVHAAAAFALATALAAAPAAAQRELTFRYDEVSGIGREAGICRRDPSDVLRVGDRHYVWYTRVVKADTVAGEHRYPSGYQGDVWGAVSEDEGRSWRELGVAVARGEDGAFDCTGVFTPNVLRHGDRFWLYYTAVGPDFDNGPYADRNRTCIAVASADSPEGPWQKRAAPVLESTRDPERFDSYRVDDSCLRVADGRIWLYYKGRQWQNTPAHTRMGVAVAARPDGPFTRLRDGAAVQSAGHEVQIFEHDGGVWSLVSPTRGADSNTLRFAADGLSFDAAGAVVAACKPRTPMAPGLYRPELTGLPVPEARTRWGIAMGAHHPDPFLVRYAFDLPARR